MARILIAGCGDIGIGIGERLVERGHRVFGLRRNPTMLPDTLIGLAADLTQIDTLRALPERIDTVVYTAAATGYSESAYRHAYQVGVENLLEVLENASSRPQRCVFISSTSVYGQQDGQWVDELSAADASGFAAEALRAGEQRVWQSPLDGIVVRSSGIYGPGRHRLIEQVLAGTARCRPGTYSNRIHSADLTGFIAHLVDIDTTESLYLAVDDEPALLCDVLRYIAEQTRSPLPTTSTDRDSVRRGSNKRCCNKRLHASGYTLHHADYRSGYRALLDQRFPLDP